MNATDQPELRVSKLRRDWIDDNYPTACLLASSMGEFSSDDLHDALAIQPDHSGWWGSIMAKLKCDGRIAEAGRVKSRRPEANGRKVTLWRAVV